MPSVNVVAETKVDSTSRIQQLSAIFDCPIEERQRLEWNANLPFDEFDWSIGLIVGPSGCGKTLIARELFGVDEVDKKVAWRPTRAVVDDFDKSLPMQAITDACSAVGFNTIPAWMRPHHVLSNGERFRAELARRLLEGGDLIVIDEFTSVVDRQVAKIASHAVQKYVRKKSGKKFVAVTCHYDVVDWLQPDWIFDPSTNQFTRRGLRRRPSLNIEICGCPYDTWEIFAPFHYMTRGLSKSSKCFALWCDGNLAAFSAMLHRPNSSDGEINVWGLSRTVTLPDYQGLGLFFVLNDTLASAFAAVDKKFNIYPVHPPFIHNVKQSDKWHMIKKPAYQAGSQSIAKKQQSNSGSTGKGFGKRPCAIFEYVGPKMDRREAETLLSYHGRWPGITYRYATTRGALERG